MLVSHHNILRVFVITLLAMAAIPAHASKYACSIDAVLDLNRIGHYKDHGWSANYLNRKFFLDRDTGKVVGTTALKARLTNFSKVVTPIVLTNDYEDYSYKVISVFEENGQFASLRIAENIDKKEKPYAYQTAVGMLLTGVCVDEKT